MKELELREKCICFLCNNPIGKTALPVFWRVRVERHGLDMKAIRRHQGLTMMLHDNAALAQAMGPDEDMTVTLGDAVEVTICEECSQKETPMLLHQIAESQADD